MSDKTNEELRHMVAKLAAHVRPTCGELWAEAERLLNRTEPPSAPVGADAIRYDAGLLSDYGGGNVEWWQDYIRSELERAHDFYTAALTAQQGGKS